MRPRPNGGRDGTRASDFLEKKFSKAGSRNVYHDPGTRSIMPHMMVHHKVRDFSRWKPFFDRHEGTRKTSGSKSAQVFQNIDDPTDVFILFEWDTFENAKKFGASEDLKNVMEQAGVIGKPHVHFLLEAQKNKA